MFGHSSAVELISVGCEDEILASNHNSGMVDKIFDFFSDDNYDTRVKMWDIQSGNEVRFLNIYESKVSALQIGKNNIFLVSQLLHSLK